MFSIEFCLYDEEFNFHKTLAPKSVKGEFCHKMLLEALDIPEIFEIIISKFQCIILKFEKNAKTQHTERTGKTPEYPNEIF